MGWRTLLALLLGMLLVSDASAKAPTDVAGEMQRYEEEIEKLAQRNAWQGVERTYSDMMALGEAVGPKYHVMGAQAATHRGDMGEAHKRLSAAITAEFDPEAADVDPVVREAWATKAGLESRYGMVELVVGDGRIPALVRFQMPFTREERMSIEYGREKLAKEHSFSGFLPVGKYMVDGEFFDVTPGPAVQRIEVAAMQGSK